MVAAGADVHFRQPMPRTHHAPLRCGLAEGDTRSHAATGAQRPRSRVSELVGRIGKPSGATQKGCQGSLPVPRSDLHQGRAHGPLVRTDQAAEIGVDHPARLACHPRCYLQCNRRASRRAMAGCRSVATRNSRTSAIRFASGRGRSWRCGVRRHVERCQRRSGQPR